MNQHRVADRHQVAIVGAGPGGICMAIKLKEAGIEDFVILERSSGAGGTWFNNRYPGLACDVPSHLYSFTFEQKPDWTRAFALQTEIKEYMQHCVAKYGLDPYIRLDTEVREAHWDDRAAQWYLATADGGTVVADVFVSALGMFNEVVWPDIAGLESFTGEVLHTAVWPEGSDLRGKTVAVIGSAASATQLIPEIAPDVRQLLVYQRTANWVLPKEDQTYTEAELAEMRANPEIGLAIRKKYHDFFEMLVTFDRPEMMAVLRQKGLDNLAQVNDPETRARLHPQLPLGSQRPLFSNEFYPTFNRPNVALVTEEIEAITPGGIRTRDGVERAVDVLVLATGYAANKYLSVIEVTGRDGVRLKDAWKDGPQAYLGITTSGFPNLFMLYGPNTNNGSILYMLERQVDYILGKLAFMEAEGLDWIDLRREVMEAYNESLQRDMDRVEVWRTLGSKYYRATSGRIVTQWPHNMAAFATATSAPDADAFEQGRRAERARARARA